jgi:hypothetical protein
VRADRFDDNRQLAASRRLVADSASRRQWSERSVATRSVSKRTDNDALKAQYDNQAELANKCSGGINLDEAAAAAAGTRYSTAAGVLSFEPLDKEQEQLLSSLHGYYDLNATQSVAYAMGGRHDGGDGRHTAASKQQQQPQLDGSRSPAAAATATKKRLPPLPRPSNLSVLIISWYPPILKLSWNLDEFELETGVGGVPQEGWQPSSDEGARRRQDSDETGASRHGAGDNDKNENSPSYDNLHRARQRPSLETNGSAAPASLPRSTDSDDNQTAAAGTSNGLGAGFDLELALEQVDREAAAAAGVGAGEPNEASSALAARLRELKLRRLLVEKSLTCFQVTYNVVNSR